MRRAILTASAALALATAGLAATATPASATPVCGSASLSGSVTGPVPIGPVCAPYPFGVLCRNQSASVSPFVGVTVDACVPAP